MCHFLSGYVSADGHAVLPGDLLHHHIAEEVHNLSEALKDPRMAPVPWEWTDDDEGESLEVRVPALHAHDEAWFRERILRRWSNRRAMLAYCVEQMPRSWPGILDLRDCTGLTALPDGLAVGGSLDLHGCTGLTALPDGLAVGGNLYGQIVE